MGTNYEDERLTAVDTEKNAALTESDNFYNDAINQSKEFYEDRVNATKEWVDTQTQLQQDRTDFTIEQIEQQREQTKKDYIKEQSGAYTDWQKQSNQYGVSAEQMAASGLNNTGYSESSKVSMYNTYQNRVAVAREAFQQASLNFDNGIREAQLANDSALAEIRYNAFIQESELLLQGFQHENSLLQAQMQAKQDIDSKYYNRYLDVLAQINQENALAEEKRQYDEQMAYKKQQDAQAYAQWQQEYALQQAKLAEEKRQYDANLAEEQRQFDLANTNAKLNDTAQSTIDKIAGMFENNNSSKSSLKETAASGLTKSYANFGTSSREADLALSAAGVNPRDCGNSAETKKKDNYYFSNGYQPQYWNNEELFKTNATVSKVFGNTLEEYGIRGSQNVWYTKGNKMCVWDGSSGTYIDVTDEYKEWAKKYFGQS